MHLVLESVPICLVQVSAGAQLTAASCGPEHAGSLQIISSTCIGMASSHGPRSWTFDHIAGPDISQEAFFAGARNSSISGVPAWNAACRLCKAVQEICIAPHIWGQRVMAWWPSCD